MALELPLPIAKYFAANSTSGKVVAECFTSGVVVKDEGHTYNGIAAMTKWMADASAKFQYTAEPFALADENGKQVVTSHVTGNFPGSPLDLRYFFELDGTRSPPWRSSYELRSSD
jgi:hypothetical protein